MKKKVYIETRTPKLPKLYTELIVNYLFFLKIIIKSSNTFSVFVMQFYTKKKKNLFKSKIQVNAYLNAYFFRFNVEKWLWLGLT